MKRRALIIVSGLLLAIAVALGWLLTSEAGLIWAFNRVAALLPGTTSVTSIDGRLVGPIHVTGLRYRAAATDDRIEELTLDWRPWALFAGRLHLTQVQARGVRIAWSATGGLPVASLPEIRLPLAVRVSNLVVDEITIAPPGSAPLHIARLELDARTRADTALIRKLVLRSTALDLSLHGHITPQADYPMDITASWTARLPDAPPLSGEGRIYGDLRRLRASQRLTAPLRADVNANLNTLLTEPRWDAELTIAALRLDRLRPGLPATTVKGGLRARGDRNQIEAEGTLAAIDHPDSDVTLSAKADWSRAGQPLRFDVSTRWRNIDELPLIPVALASARGTLQAHGTIDAYTLSLDADLAHARAGAMHLNGDAQGGRTALSIRQARLQALGGALEARGHLDWQRHLAWRLALDGRNLDPGKLWPQWPGQLSVRAESDGQLGKTLAARLTGAEVQGRLREQPFMLRGAADINGQDYTLDRLELRAGSTTLRAAGRVTDQWDVSWNLQSPDLAHLLPDISGSLATEGHVLGARGTPSITATVAGKGLRYRAYRVDAINTQMDVDLADARASRLTLAAQGISAFGAALRSLDVQAQGRAAAHEMRIVLDGAHGQLRLAGDGQYQDRHWHGMLREATLTSSDLGNWTLEEPGDILASRTEAVLQSSCWLSEDARLCGAGMWQAAKGWIGQLSAARLPTSVFAPFLTTGATLRGTLDATAQLQASAAGARRGLFTLRLSAGNISVPKPDGTPVAFGYGGGQATVRIADERLDSTLQMQLANGGMLDTALAAPLRADESDGSQPLRGQLKAEIRNLDALSVLVPQLEQPRGELAADLTLDGTVAHPRLAGTVALQHGALDIGRAGVRLRDASLSATSTGGGGVDIKGQVSSGGGVLRVTGSGTLRPAGWRATLQLQGDRFEAVKTPELWLRVSPDLTVDAQPYRVDLRGDIDIPEGRFAAKDISQAVNVSPDTLIVGETNGAAPTRWQVYTRVKIALGDAVRVDAYNFRGKVTGTVIAVDEPQKTTTGTGELRFESGTYIAYGTQLTINPGRLLFNGGPIADPGLDVRASRQVGDVLAGVQVAGTLRRPELTLYSQPAMNQSDTLSYLLLGKPTSQASAADGAMLANAAGSLGLAGGELLARRIGQAFGIEEVRIESGSGAESASLMLGTYLSPRLYVAYGIGLFAPVNTLRLRYDLSRHWKIQTESGAATSADVLYTIER